MKGDEKGGAAWRSKAIDTLRREGGGKGGGRGG